MHVLLTASRMVDRATTHIGHAAGWLCLAMVLVGAFNAVARYAGRHIGTNLASNVYIELQWYLFGLVFLFAAPYALRRDAHVRVDVVYGCLSPRGKAIVDLAGTAIFLVPFTVFVLVVSWPSVAASWSVLEGSPDPGGLPRYPIKTAVLAAFALLLLQAMSEAVRRIAALRGVLSANGDDGPEGGRL